MLNGGKVLYFKANRAEALINIIALVLFIAFVIGQGILAFERSPSSDDALFLSVPKNWLNDYGWATSYSEKIPFNPDFTGPAALLLPAALLIKIFGNQWWIGGVTGWAVNLVLSALCLWQIRRYGRNPALIMLCLCGGIVAAFAQDFSSLIGYYTGSLLFLLSACVSFNKSYSIKNCALFLGIATSISLLIKPLLLPAFIWLNLVFLLSVFIQAKKLLILIVLLVLPSIFISSTSFLLQKNALQDYSTIYQANYQQYKQDFIHHHGSGIGQWLQAEEKLPYLFRNANKNLYFVEEGLAEFGIKNPFLGNEPADIYHIVGILYVLGLIAISIITFKKIIQCRDVSPFTWLIFSINTCILIYILWFVIFAMAMSPGHLYFPMQWSLWLLFVLAAQLLSTQCAFKNTALTSLVVLLSIGVIMEPATRKSVFLWDNNAVQKTAGLDQAIQHLTNTHASQLAGCGYNGYPRHIEYRLPTSQNFADCLDLIEDHVIRVGEHYQWKSPLAFTLVLSLQTLSFDPAVAPISAACMNNVLYRNRDILIFQCSFEDLKTINLDALMPKIDATHQWYKTRLSNTATPK